MNNNNGTTIQYFSIASAMTLADPEGGGGKGRLPPQA